MDIETKIDMIKRSPTEELIKEEELRELLQTKEHPGHYIGFEISGLLHIGSLIMTGMKINDLNDAGVKTQVFLADWHSVINKKLGGDWEKIQLAAKYYAEAFRFFTNYKTATVLGSDLYDNDKDYWKNVMRVSSKSTLNRITRCLTIMGRKETDSLDMAQFFYPPMQAADIHTIGADIVHAGMDQRKIHMLAREVFPKLGLKPPIALHNHLIPGLAEPISEGFETDRELDKEISSKMSKSKPWTCIFIHDTKEQIAEKLKKAYCPPKISEKNPILEMIRYIIFRYQDTFEIARSEKYGGNLEFDSFAKLEHAYTEGEIHPMDLKNSLVDPMDKIIKPIRDHFEKPANKKLLDIYKSTEITR